MKDKIKIKWIYIRWLLLRVSLAVFDILAVNASILIALYTRFYVAYEFHNSAHQYFDAYFRYAPYYTVFCLAIFLIFRLYSSMWRYAGLHDLNRILTANVICIAGHVLGTVLFFARMPISVYCISALLQIGMITASRFTYRILMLEKEKTGTKGKINTVVVGTGVTAQIALSQLARDEHLNAVCAVDYLDSGFIGTMDGLPVMSGIRGIKEAIEKYSAEAVILADGDMPQSIRTEIKNICGKSGVSVYDYYGLRESLGRTLTQSMLDDRVRGPVNIRIGGKSRRFESYRDFLKTAADNYAVKALTAENGIMNIELENIEKKPLNDLSEDWVKEQERETGEEISFF